MTVLAETTFTSEPEAARRSRIPCFSCGHEEKDHAIPGESEEAVAGPEAPAIPGACADFNPQFMAVDMSDNLELGESEGRRLVQLYRCLTCEALLFERQMKGHEHDLKKIEDVGARRLSVDDYTDGRNG